MYKKMWKYEVALCNNAESWGFFQKQQKVFGTKKKKRLDIALYLYRMGCIKWRIVSLCIHCAGIFENKGKYK